jgi:hypothetical protein
VDVLSDPRGGLMVLAAVYGEVPMENIEAICEGFERYCLGA